MPTGPASDDVRDVDVLVLGAGIAGIGGAWHLLHELTDHTVAVLEARDQVGGTWDLFRFPGVRSDSDMYTLALPFRPWRRPESRADGETIRTYLQDAVDAHRLDDRMWFGRTAIRAEWSSADARWTVRATVGEETETWRCRFLYGCTGYYDYAAGYTPELPGVEEFGGRVVHPQHWPADLDVRGRRVAVVGSGATAVTLVPALADAGAEVTMVQRSPSWVASVDQRGAADRWTGRLPASWSDRVARERNAAVAVGLYELSRRRPGLVSRFLTRGMREVVGAEAVAEHFTPGYHPWDQRLCIAPEGDFLRVLAERRAQIVTGRIQNVDADGIAMADGRHVAAEILVTATGLVLQPLGGLDLVVDGQPVDLGRRYVYRGALVSGVPNLAMCVGYINASWTLRAEVTHAYVIRLLRYLRDHDLVSGTPVAPVGMPARPVLALTSGYVQRGVDVFPKQGDREPWTVRQNWFVDRRRMRRADVTQDMTFVSR